jgi:hypothetical protein
VLWKTKEDQEQLPMPASKILLSHDFVGLPYGPTIQVGADPKELLPSSSCPLSGILCDDLITKR